MDVNYTFAFAGDNQTPVVLPDGPMYGNIRKVDYETWKKRATGYGWNPQGTDIFDPTVTTVDQARAKYGIGNGSLIQQGQTQYDRLLAEGGIASKAIRAAETGGAPISFGKMIDGNMVGNEAIKAMADNEAAYARGEMTKTFINGVPVYQPKNAAPFQQGSVGQDPGMTVQTPSQTPQNAPQQAQTGTMPNTQGMAQSYTLNGQTSVLNPQTGRYELQQGSQPQGTQTAQSYTVKPGDTLSAIAARFGVPISSITGYRSGNPNKIYSGETLQIGKAQPVYTPAPQTAATSTGTTAPKKSAIQEKVDRYTEASTALGLPSIKAQYENVLKEQQKIMDAQNKELQDIANDPWLVQSVRDARSQKVKDKYETKLNTYSNLGKLYESLYEKGLTQVKEIVNDVEADEKFAAQLADKQQTAANAIMRDNQIVSINGRQWLVSRVTGQKLVDLGPVTVTSKSSSSGSGSSGSQSLEDMINDLFK